MGDTGRLRILLAVLMTLTLGQGGKAGDWPMFMYDAANIGNLDVVSSYHLNYFTQKYNDGKTW